jgi:hypothetical protein
VVVAFAHYTLIAKKPLSATIAFVSPSIQLGSAYSKRLRYFEDVAD